MISEAACERALDALEAAGWVAAIGPAVPYGVTECAAAFPGAVSIPASALTAFLSAVVSGYLNAGADHVCLVNNHLEPAHDAAVRAATTAFGIRASIACPLTRAVARTLTDEFKRGECHAGRYETSIIMAAVPDSIDESARQALPEVPISLSTALRAGTSDFLEMGLDQAYAGAPAAASAAEGHESLDRLADMILAAVPDIGDFGNEQNPPV